METENEVNNQLTNNQMKQLQFRNTFVSKPKIQYKTLQIQIELHMVNCDNVATLMRYLFATVDFSCHGIDCHVMSGCFSQC